MILYIFLSYFVVKFNHNLNGSEKKAIEDLGYNVISYSYPNSYIVHGDNPEKLLINIPDISIEDYSIPLSWLNSISKDSHDTLKVLLFPTEDVENFVDFCNENEINIIDYSDRFNKIFIVKHNGNFNKLLQYHGIHWIEEYQKPRLFNANAQWVTQTWQKDNRKIWDYGIKGNGEIGSVGDSGVRTTHLMFLDPDVEIGNFGDYPQHRKIIAYRKGSELSHFGDESANHYHGTHVSGTVCGYDDPVGGKDLNDGMAPEAKLFFIDLGSISGFSLPPDMYEYFNTAYTGNEAGRPSISSNSWGWGGYGVYSSSSLNVDQFMWDHKDFLIFFANGNDSPNRVSPPATAKNCVSVGACQNGENANQITSFTSPGPTNDGRIKPTVTAPGVLVSAYGGSDNGSTFMEGTSMATPCVAGSALLIRQYIREGWFHGGVKNTDKGFSPSAALIKAMLINSCQDTSGYFSPDNKWGWGRINLDNVLYFPGEDRKLFIIDDTVGFNDLYTINFNIDVLSGSTPLKFTLVWTDAPPSLSSEKQIVNDLDLTVYDPEGNKYYGNVFSGGFSVSGGNPDRTNVEENVWIPIPDTGTWTVSVSAVNLPQPPQPFALVITGDISQYQPNLVFNGMTTDHGNKLMPSDSGTLFVSLYNASQNLCYNITATLSTDNPKVHILDSVSHYQPLGSEMSSKGSGFSFKTDDLKDGERVNFTMKITANNGDYNSEINFFVKTNMGINSEKIKIIFLKNAIVDRDELPFLINGYKKIHYRIFSIDGRVIEEKNLSISQPQTTIPIKNLPAGPHFIQVNNKIFKFVKIK